MTGACLEDMLLASFYASLLAKDFWSTLLPNPWLAKIICLKKINADRYLMNISLLY